MCRFNFAAGDNVSFPLLTYGVERVTIDHWGLAMYLGRVAALNIMGKERYVHTVPFFWTVHIGLSLRNAGLLVRVRQCLTYEGNVVGGDGHGHGDWLVQGQGYQAQQ